jgi:hypothetical protein
MVVDADQRGLPALLAPAAAQGLAIDGQHRPSLGERTVDHLGGGGVAAAEHPSGQRRLHRGDIHAAQQPAEGARMRSPSAVGDVVVGDRRPVRDRRPGVRAGQHGGQSEMKHRLQSVTAFPPGAWIQHGLQRLQQRARLDGG